ncbi:MAG: hypothetical protein EA356_12880 [Geminicoccaceae bacterium]|nr:MAG: hypothetical protein EA356_12880 [Geminicoccaceae bacterium]
MAPLVLDRRALAALRPVDRATGAPVTAPLAVTAPGLRFTRNRSGLFTVTGVVPRTAAERELAEHLESFTAPPSTPPAESLGFALTLADPAGRYLPRRLTLRLPRTPALVQQPIDVALFPAATAPLAPNWSAVRARLQRVVGGQPGPLSGARLRLLRDADDVVLGEGFSDARGEALAIAVGIPVIDFTLPSNGDGDDDGSAVVGTTSVLARLAVHTASAAPEHPADPDAITATPFAWAPIAGPMPNVELRTGREVAGLTLLLGPTTT